MNEERRKAVNNSEKKWYALYVNVRHEKKVMNKLLEKGMEAYVPLVKQMRQWSDRKKMVEMPLFTGYVFVKLFAVEMDKPRWVEGVINFLKFEKKYAVVKNEEMEGLKYFVEHGYNVNSEETALKPGRKVKICLSQFKDWIAVIESFDSGKDVLVSFEGIRKNLLVRVPKSALKTIG